MAESEHLANYMELYRKLQALEERLAQLEKAQATHATPPPIEPPPLPSERLTGRETTPTLPQPVTASAESAVEELAAAIVEPAAATESEIAAPAKLAEQAFAEVPPASSTPPPVRPTESLEQKIGQKWMLVAGLGIMLLGGAFFFKYAYDQGWISPVRRCIMGVIWAIGLLCVGEYTFRKAKRFFAAGLFGAGIVWLYYTGWVTSPNGWYAQHQMLTANQAFAAMCGITALGVFLALRANMIFGAIIALVGAMATPALLSTGVNRQVELLSYLLVVDVAFLAVALWRRWTPLVPIALAGTIALIASWAVQFIGDSPAGVSIGFGWAMFLLFFAYVIIARQADRVPEALGGLVFEVLGKLLLLVSAVAFVVLLMESGLAAEGVMLNLLLLATVVLLAGQALHWCYMPLAGLLWTMIAISWLWAGKLSENQWRDPAVQLLWARWMWYFFAIFAADIFARALRREAKAEPIVDACVSGLATAGLFLSTYFLLHEQYPNWMGVYTTSLAIMCGLGALLLHRRADRPILTQTFFAMALGLLILAVPIQFDNLATTLVWSAMGLVMILLAKRFRSLILLLAPPITIALATFHFFAWELPNDPAVQDIAFTVNGIDIKIALLVAVELAAVMWTMVLVLETGKRIVSEEFDQPLAITLGIAGLAVFLFSTAVDLPAMASTWCWIVAVMGVLLLGLVLRKPWIGTLMDILLPIVLLKFCISTAIELPVITATWYWIGAVVGVYLLGLLLRRQWAAVVLYALLAATVAKWIAYDTLFLRLDDAANMSQWYVANWQFLAGVVLAGFAIALPRLQKFGNSRIAHSLAGMLGVVGLFIILWAGSFEVDRYVQNHRGWLTDPVKALHMGLSLWCGLWATITLAGGFALRRAMVRYFAIALFGITILKVLIFDMQGVTAAYRILSFIALGVLLIAGSWLYHRYFLADKPAGAAQLPDKQDTA